MGAVTLVVYRTARVRRSQRYRWRLVAANGRRVAVSGEGYANRADCLEMASRVVSGEFGDCFVVVRPPESKTEPRS